MTTLELEYEGKKYILGYDLASIERLDRNNVIADALEGKRPLTLAKDLFCAAFNLNHKNVSQATREEIFRNVSIDGEDGSLIECLMEMISEVVEEMTPKGNVKWRKVRN